MTTTTSDKGWAFPTLSARKCHYFGADGRSLCGRYGSFGLPPDAFTPSTTNVSSPDDCAACTTRLGKRGTK